MKKILLYIVTLLLISNIALAKKKITIPIAKNILVFAPHPDDDIIGCAGLLAHQRNAGSTITITYITSGDAAYWPDGPAALAQTREKEAFAACRLIDVENLIFLRQPDGKVSTHQKEIMQRIIPIILSIKPDIILIPHKNDAHKDHQATYDIVTGVLPEINKHYYPLVLGYEVWTPIQDVTHSQEVTYYIDLKLQALKEHASQVTYVDYIEAIKGLNRYRGITLSDGNYAECFQKVE